MACGVFFFFGCKCVKVAVRPAHGSEEQGSEAWQWGIRAYSNVAPYAGGNVEKADLQLKQFYIRVIHLFMHADNRTQYGALNPEVSLASFDRFERNRRFCLTHPHDSNITRISLESGANMFRYN